MSEYKELKQEKPSYWMQDHGNVFAHIRMACDLAREMTDYNGLFGEAAKTFKERFDDPLKHYGRKKPEIKDMPKTFIRKTSRLTRVYNSLINEKPINLQRMKKFSGIVDRVFRKEIRKAKRLESINESELVE